jgi:hypothetical protein
MLKFIKNIEDKNMYSSKHYFCTANKLKNMLQKFIAFSLLLILIASCSKIETPKFVDYVPIDKKIIQDYLKEKGVTNADSTASGLYYIIHKPGNDVHPTLLSNVTVNYTGYLTDGTIFDASPAGKPFTDALSGLIAGWQEGLPLIGVGGKISLLCPSALGYGSRATGKIPANSVILFNIELVSLQGPPAE